MRHRSLSLFAPLFAMLLAAGGLTGCMQPRVAVAEAPTVNAWPGKANAPTTVLTAKGLVGGLNDPIPVAPTAFAVDGGTTYVFAPVTHQIRSFVNGVQVAAATIPDVTVYDMIIEGRTATVLAADNKLYTFTLSGSKATQTSVVTIKAPKAHEEANTFIHDGSTVWIGTNLDRWVKLSAVRTARLAAGPDFSVSFTPFKTATGYTEGTFTVAPAPGQKLSINLPFSTSSVELLYRGGGRVFYLACNEYDDADGILTSDHDIFEYTDTGRLVATYTAPLQRTIVPPRQFVVAGGTLYQLLIDDATTKVLRLTPDTPTPALVTPVITPSASARAAATKLSKAKGGVRYRALIVARAKRLAAYKWTYSKVKNGNTRSVSSVVLQPHFLLHKSTWTGAGLPYTWGGYDSDLTKSQGNPWKNFTKGLNGYGFAGNINNVGQHQRRTIGLDCSGFISAVFGVGKTKLGTTDLLDGRYFVRTPGSPQAGDIMVKVDGTHRHTFLVLKRYKKNRKDVVDALEETTTPLTQKGVADKTYLDVAFPVGSIPRVYKRGVYVNWRTPPRVCGTSLHPSCIAP